MEEKIKGIVSVFIKVPADQIVAGTPIDRSALQSSILLHRMYARLAEEGVVVQNYVNIKFFGDLLREPGQTGYVPVSVGAEATMPRAQMPGTPIPGASMLGTPMPGMGVDIEEIAALPRAGDFRKEQFYIMNFTASEIAYCILQPDPYSSLAGLFAAKEAMIKADVQFRSRAFNTLEINHSPEGAPLFPGFALSISHAGGMAVAIAARTAGGSAGTAGATGARGSAGGGSWITWMALVLAIAALLVALKH